MKNCERCNKNYPEELIHEMCINGDYFPMCAICGLHERNEISNTPIETPFNGPVAHAMFMNAVSHLIKTNQTCPTWAKQIWEKQDNA